MTEDNRVTFEADGITRVKWVGDQTVESVRRTLTEADGYARAMVRQGKPVLMLFDTSMTGKQNLQTRREGIRLVKTINYGVKVAMINAGAVERAGVNFILMITKKSGSVRFFATEKEALKFLRG